MSAADEVIDAGGRYVSAGFIDMHIHGAGGYDFLDKSEEAYKKIAQMTARHGATSILPTLTSVDREGMKTAIEIFKRVKDSDFGGSNLLGLHAEGPYFAESQKGAQDDRFIRPFDPEEYSEILDTADGCLLRWSAAPELDGSNEFATTLLSCGVLPSMGHSDADSEPILCAVRD